MDSLPSQPGDVPKETAAPIAPKRWTNEEDKRVKEILAAHIEAENNGLLPPMDMKQMWQLVSEKLKENGFTRSASAIETRFRGSIAIERRPVATAGHHGLGVTFPNLQIPGEEATRSAAWEDSEQKALFALLTAHRDRNNSNEEKSLLSDTDLWKLMSSQLSKNGITRSPEECAVYWDREGEALYTSQAGEDHNETGGIAKGTASQLATTSTGTTSSSGHILDNSIQGFRRELARWNKLRDNAEPSSNSKETDAAPARDAPWASVTRYRHRPLDYSTPKSPTIDDKYPILRPQISKTPLDHSSIAQANKQNKHPRWGQGATASLPSEPFEGRAAGMHSFGLVDRGFQTTRTEETQLGSSGPSTEKPSTHAGKRQHDLSSRATSDSYFSRSSLPGLDQLPPGKRTRAETGSTILPDKPNDLQLASDPALTQASKDTARNYAGADLNETSSQSKWGQPLTSGPTLRPPPEAHPSFAADQSRIKENQNRNPGIPMRFSSPTLDSTIPTKRPGSLGPMRRPWLQDGILKIPAPRFGPHSKTAASTQPRSPALSDNSPGGGQFQQIANRRVQKQENEIADIERNRSKVDDEIKKYDQEIEALRIKLAAMEAKKAEKMIESAGLDEELSLSKSALEWIRREVQARQAGGTTPDLGGSSGGFA